MHRIFGAHPRPYSPRWFIVVFIIRNARTRASHYASEGVGPRELTDGPSHARTPPQYNVYAYTREGTLRHTYVRPDIDRQLATVTVYNSVRLVAPVSCRNTLLRASQCRCSLQSREHMTGRLESRCTMTRIHGRFLR